MSAIDWRKLGPLDEPERQRLLALLSRESMAGTVYGLGALTVDELREVAWLSWRNRWSAGYAVRRKPSISTPSPNPPKLPPLPIRKGA